MTERVSDALLIDYLDSDDDRVADLAHALLDARVTIAALRQQLADMEEQAALTRAANIIKLDCLWRFLHEAWKGEGSVSEEGSHGADLHDWSNEIYNWYCALRRIERNNRCALQPPSPSPSPVEAAAEPGSEVLS